MPIITLTRCPVCGNDDIQKALEVVDHFSSGETFPLCHCPRCGLRFTNHFPSEETIGTYYDSPNYISHSDTRKGVANRLYHLARTIMLKRKVQLVVKHTDRQPARLLDMGCGTGYFLQAAKEKGMIVSGIEKDKGARAYANQRFGLEVAPEEHFWELESRSFHAVTLWHVLEHIEKLNESIEKIREILTDDGVAIIAVPNPLSVDAAFYQEYWAAYDVPRHLWHFSPRSMEQLLQQHGMSIVKKQTLPLDAFYISLLSEKYKGSRWITTLARSLCIGTVGFLRGCANPKHASSIIYIVKKREGAKDLSSIANNRNFEALQNE